MADVERVFGLADEVLRHKVIRLPDKVAGRRGRRRQLIGNGRGATWPDNA